jgi:hypothetical protein
MSIVLAHTIAKGDYVMRLATYERVVDIIAFEEMGQSYLRFCLENGDTICCGLQAQLNVIRARVA